ncbi:MAG: tetratricopeptide repeat protein, partial [Acutalibacteraceae bacterium]
PSDAPDEVDSLDKELEDLRDLFQKQLDEETAKALSEEENADEEAEDADFSEPTEEPEASDAEEYTDEDGFLIQPLDEIETSSAEGEQTEEKAEVRLCECCGEKPCDTSLGEDYPYCSECRALMKANPLNPCGILALVIMILVCAASLFVAAPLADDYDTLLSAQSAYSEKKLTDAVSYYQTYLSSKGEDDVISMKAVRNTVDAMTVLGYYGDADSLIETYISESKMKLPKYKKYADIRQEYTLLSETSTVINESFSDVLSGEDFDYDSAIKKADKLIEENKTSQKYSDAFLEYAKFIIMLAHKDDNAAQIAQLKKIEEIDGGKHPWIYITYIISAAAKEGDIETATEYFDKSLEYNTQEMSLYVSYADVYRFCDKPDADKMIEIAQKAASVYPQNAYPVFYRTYALAYLLKGDTEKAMTNMENYMQNCQTSLSDMNLYALCALCTDDEDTYNDIVTYLEAQGYSIGKTVQQYKKGKLTLKQVLTDNGGDI